MGIFDRLSRSSILAAGMADRLGVDLAQATVRDMETSAHRLRSATLRCSFCHEQEACMRLLAKSDTLPNAPLYCRNRDNFAALAHA